MRTLVWPVLLLGMAQANAEMPPLTDKDALISWVLERFWGNAQDSSGMLIQPESELDRRTVPVPTVVAYRAIEAGEISGLAAWCGLEWKTHYFSLTASARRLGMSDKQVAFVSMLHGSAQGSTLKGKTGSCSDSERNRVRIGLELSESLGLEPSNTSPERTLEL